MSFLRPSSLKKWIQLREKPLPDLQLKDTFWFHAASGEIEYGKAVIRGLKSRVPNAQVVVTYTSPSAEKLFANIRDQVDFFIPLPWDRPGQIRNLLKTLNPKIIIFSRTDLWPELIYQARKAKIPLGLISALPQKSLSQKWLAPKFTFVSSVETDGDTRFDQVFYRLNQTSKLQIQPNSKTLVCGSTWPEDEEILFKIFSELIHKGFKIVLSPHDVSESNLERVKSALQKYEWSFETLGTQKQIQADILLIDKIGYLADAYRFADFAFVGGSFKDKVHSVMEPLCCGLVVLTGPHIKNNPEALRYLNRYVFKVESAEQMKSILLETKIAKSAVISEMQKNQNASLRVLNRIFDTLPKT